MKMTYILILATILFSVAGFNNRQVFDQYKFNAFMVYKRKEWYRLLSHGFLHLDWMHLFVNMLVLYFFGCNLEEYFSMYESIGVITFSTTYYLLLYITAIVASSLYSLHKYRNDHSYNAIGASGAVSAILFATIFFDPWAKIYVLFSLPIPGFIYGLLYLAYSQYMGRKRIDNIGHDAHFYGAIYGFLFPLIIGVPLSHFLAVLFG